MKKNCRKITVIFFSLFLYSTWSFSQITADDSLSYTSSLNVATGIYHKAVYPAVNLYTGPQYFGYPFTFRQGQQFYQNVSETTGWIKYDGILYKAVSLKYELVQEKVLVMHPVSQILMTLVNERISSFNLYNTTFIHIRNDSAHHSIAPGFYALLYEGAHTCVLKKNRKTIREDISTNEGILRFVDEHINYYIQKGHIFYPVASKKSVLKVFADRKKEIHQYIKKNNFNMRNINDEALVQIASYYEAL